MVVTETTGGAPALAQAGTPPVTSAERRIFDIAPQPLAEALITFGRQAGLQVSANADLLEGRRSSDATGSMTWPEALSTLLAGSGLTYRQTGSIIALEPIAQTGGSGPARLAPITVEAVLSGILTDSYAAPDNFAATRTDTPNIDTPQSTQAVTRQVLEDSGVTEVAGTFDYLAGITRDTNTAGIFGDAYLARGFVTDNILLNGNRSGRPTTLDTANIERVEALRGPTATLFGRADPGGLINIITKQPLSAPFHQVELTGGAGFFDEGRRFGDARAAVDSGGPIDDQGRMRYRFNAAVEHDRTFRQDVDQSIVFLSPVIDFEVDDRTILNMELIYQYRQDVFDRGVFFTNGDLDLPRDFYIGEERAPELNSHYASGTLRVDRELTDTMTTRFGLYGSYNNVAGEGVEQADVDGTEVAARRVDNDISEFFLTAQPELVAEVTTGPVGHTVLFGVDASLQRSRFDFQRGASGLPIDALDPVFPVDLPAIDLMQPGNDLFESDYIARSIGIYVQDQIDITGQLKLLLGARWDVVWISSNITNAFNRESLITDGRDEDFNDRAFLPRAGIVYQPIEAIGLYASYAETYRAPPATSPLRDADGNQVDPEEGRSLEAGIKLEALDGALAGTLAVFRADKDNVLEADPADPFALTNLGEVRSRGVEFDLAGEVIDNLSLGVSYTFTDAQIDNDDGGFPSGTRLRNVPRHTASFRAAYRFTDGTLEGLRVFGGFVYEGEKPSATDAPSPPDIPSYVRFDLGASYEFNEQAQAVIRINNLTDEEYYTSATRPDRVSVGQPFNVALGVRLRF